MIQFRRTALAAVSLIALGLAGPALSQTAAWRAPHVSETTAPVTVTFGGKTYVNQGLVGAGQLSAALRDFNGDSLGSFSAMAISGWRRGPDGVYHGRLTTLPDRGPNGVGTIAGTTAYQNRLHTFDLSFTPAKGPATTSPTQVVLSPTGGLLLTDPTGAGFTGMDPAAGVLTRGQIAYPSAASGPTAGRISLDSEGLAMLADGSFYVSDEYGALIYLFDAKGVQVGAIPAPAAIQPIVGGQVNFAGGAAPDTGRRNNQGLEGVSLTPDGKRLVTLLQSATVQDSAAGKDRDDSRGNTRLLIYDIAKSRTPQAPVGHYVVQLPSFRNKGDGGPADKTAGASELLALNDHQFLVLARDSNGRGANNSRPAVYRAVQLIDIAKATNLAGTDYETTARPVAPNGVLSETITPAAATELVNVIAPAQVARLGLNLDNAATNAFTLPEKLEAMALAPALDPAAPNDVFLLVGSDNDFQTATGVVGGMAYDAGVKTADGAPAGDNDSLILVYRLTLPADTAL